MLIATSNSWSRPIHSSNEKSSTITAQHLQTALARIPIARDKINR